MAAVLGLSGCASESVVDSPPPVDQVGLYLHTCLQLPSEESDACVDAALADCPTEYVSREECLAESLENLAAFEAYEPTTPGEPELPTVVLLGIAFLTLGGLCIVGGVVSRRTRRRNSEAFDDAANVLRRSGFVPVEPSEFPSTIEVNQRFQPVRGMVLRDESDIWVMEFEHPAGGVNKAWPTRAVAIEADTTLPVGAIWPLRGPEAQFANSFPESAVRAALANVEAALLPSHPDVSFAIGGGFLTTAAGSSIKPIGRRTPPALSMVELVELARLIKAEIEAGTLRSSQL